MGLSYCSSGSDAAQVLAEEVWWLPDPVPPGYSVLTHLYLQ